MKFNVIDTNGEKVKCDIIGMFESENKKFVVYTECQDEDIEKEVYASLYELDENNNMILLPIINDRDWDLVDNFLGEI